MKKSTKAGVYEKLDEVWLRQKNRSKFYDKTGLPITLGQWCQRMEDDSYRRVAFSIVGDVHVSTVWLGIDQNCWGKGAPVLFETMTFRNAGTVSEGQWRWATLEEALEGHQRVVSEVQSRT